MAKKKIIKKVEKQLNLFVNKMMGSGLTQEENTADGERYVTPGMPEQIRALAGEGIVLLKNKNNVLPLKSGDNVAVFGRTQHDWIQVGYGSGGDVHPPYELNFFDVLKEAGIAYNHSLRKVYDKWCENPDNEAEHGFWGNWPFYQEELQVTKHLAELAHKESNVALVIIGRAAGEDRENVLEPGSYYLTEKEKEMLYAVTNTFDRTVLIMNCGNIVDLAFLTDYHLDAVLYAWQLGQESVHVVADVLSGKVNPSGKLSDTIAKSYEAYPSSDCFGGKEFNNYVEDIYIGYRYFTTFAPDRILYPFGFGLSYTTFEMEPVQITKNEQTIIFDIKVTNTGAASGKEVVQIYVSAPMGKLGKARKSLVGYKKTSLLDAGESEVVQITTDLMDFASFDDHGLTGFIDSYVLEEGVYQFFLGNDCMTENIIYTWEAPVNLMLKKCEEICNPDEKNSFWVLNPVGEYDVDITRNRLPAKGRQIALGRRSLRQRILERMPSEIPTTPPRGIRLRDVRRGTHTLDEFIAQLSDVELASLTRGEGFMGSHYGTAGNAGAFGGITESLRDKGIPAVITADGPAGLRVCRYTTLLPNGTSIACTWNPELIEETFVKIGEEAGHFNIDMNLAPGMNIHRNPLCGRNFEYYSEDPMLSGRTAAATVRGIQRGGTAACPKHFACNNQEYNRNHNDTRISMRALREIYLKNFEYCVKEGKPQSIMTSYNKINGVWSHYNYDLVTTVLRREWGFDGVVITDWWMRKDTMPEFPKISDNAYRTRAQVDVLMPGNLGYTKRKFDLDKNHIRKLGEDGYLTRAELQRSARNVLTFILDHRM